MLLFKAMKGTLMCGMLALAHGSAGQVQVDGSIQLTGTSEALRQVTGIATPEGLTDALPVSRVRSGPLIPAAAANDQWVVDLPASMLPLQPGVALAVIAPVPVPGTVVMAVNNGAVFPVRYATSVDLMGASISPGTIVSLVFDGNAFQVMSRPTYELFNCPAGMVAIGTQFCMDIAPTGPAVDFFPAAVACGDRGMRLCTWGEFIAGCDRRVELGITVIGEYEWVSSTCNEDGYVRIAGFSSCPSTACNVAVGGTPRTFRCCTER